MAPKVHNIVSCDTAEAQIWIVYVRKVIIHSGLSLSWGENKLLSFSTIFYVHTSSSAAYGLPFTNAVLGSHYLGLNSSYTSDELCGLSKLFNLPVPCCRHLEFGNNISHYLGEYVWELINTCKVCLEYKYHSVNITINTTDIATEILIKHEIL